MTGIVNSFETSEASFAGTFSKTKAKQPNFYNILASFINLFASASSFALTV